MYCRSPSGRSETTLLLRLSAVDSSVLAERLHYFLYGSADNPPVSLAMIPVFLPGPGLFDENALKVCRRLFGFSPAYGRIFGDVRSPAPEATSIQQELALADRLDTILTGISDEGRPFGLAHNDVYTWETLKLGGMEALALGDMGGALLPYPTLTLSQQNQLRRNYERWTGLRLEPLKQCSARAAQSHGSGRPPGVVVFAFEPEKARCIVESVRLGLVNHRIINTPVKLAIEAALETRTRE